MAESITYNEAISALSALVAEYEHTAKVTRAIVSRYARYGQRGKATGRDMRDVMLGGIGESRPVILQTGVNLETLAASVATSLTREQSTAKRQESREIRQARLAGCGHETGLVNGAPLAHLGMVAHIDTKWHGTGYGEKQTAKQAYSSSGGAMRNHKPETLAQHGTNGTKCVRLCHGRLYRVEITSKQRRTLKRLLPKVADGTASAAMKLEVLGILNDLALLR